MLHDTNFDFARLFVLLRAAYFTRLPFQCRRTCLEYFHQKPSRHSLSVRAGTFWLCAPTEPTSAFEESSVERRSVNLGFQQLLPLRCRH